MKKILLPLITVCCLSPVAAFAGHPLITDSAQTVEPIKHEAETAIEYAKKSGEKEMLVQETMTVGVCKNVDTFIAAPFKTKTGDEGSVSGLSDISLGFKWNAKTVDATAFAVKPFLVLPAGGVGEGGVGGGLIGIVTQDISKHFAIDGNLLVKYQSTREDVYRGIDASVAGRYEVAKELKTVGEVALSTASNRNPTAIVGVGLVYGAMEYLDVDLGARVGLTPESEEFRLLAGVTCKF